MDCRFRGYDGHSDRVSSRPHFGHSRTDAPTSIIPAHPRASTPTSVMHAQTIRRSREGGNPSPTRSRPQTSVVPAQAPIRSRAGTPHPSFPRRRESIHNRRAPPNTRRSREGGNPSPTRRHPQTSVVPAKAGIHPQHAGTPNIRRSRAGSPHIRRSRAHPTSVMHAKGDLCVTPVAGDSVAEMPSIPSREPPALDSRLRGNDGCSKVFESGNPSPTRRHAQTSVVPAQAGTHPQHAGTPKSPTRRHPHIRRSRAFPRRHPTSVMHAKGDLCVTPVAGDSVAEMPSIPSREPPALDSRLRGNDGCSRE